MFAKIFKSDQDQLLVYKTFSGKKPALHIACEFGQENETTEVTLAFESPGNTCSKAKASRDIAFEKITEHNFRDAIAAIKHERTKQQFE